MKGLAKTIIRVRENDRAGELRYRQVLGGGRWKEEERVTLQ